MSTLPGKPKINQWVWVAAWMGVIFFFSTDLFSGAQTSRCIGPFLKWFVPEISAESIATVQLVVRKIAHLAEYAILSILSCHALAQRAAPSPLPLAALGQAGESSRSLLLQPNGNFGFRTLNDGFDLPER